MRIALVFLVVVLALLAWYAWNEHQRAEATGLLTVAPPAPAPAMAAIYSGGRIAVGASQTYVDRPRPTLGNPIPESWGLYT